MTFFANVISNVKLKIAAWRSEVKGWWIWWVTPLTYPPKAADNRSAGRTSASFASALFCPLPWEWMPCMFLFTLQQTFNPPKYLQLLPTVHNIVHSPPPPWIGGTGIVPPAVRLECDRLPHRDETSRWKTAQPRHTHAPRGIFHGDRPSGWLTEQQHLTDNEVRDSGMSCKSFHLRPFFIWSRERFVQGHLSGSFCLPAAQCSSVLAVCGGRGWQQPVS